MTAVYICSLNWVDTVRFLSELELGGEALVWEKCCEFTVGCIT